MDVQPLPRSFYRRHAEDVAKDLLGKVLHYGDGSGKIVEVEAYLGIDDLAAHAARGITPRTRLLFGPPGFAYVYLIYGMYECLNIVADEDGTPGCVLLRALEPLSGIESMRTRRPAAQKIKQLTSGPGRLTQALGISRELNGTDVTIGPLIIAPPVQSAAFNVITTTRIGIQKCADWPLRFYMEGNAFVSRA